MEIPVDLKNIGEANATNAVRSHVRFTTTFARLQTSRKRNYKTPPKFRSLISS